MAKKYKPTIAVTINNKEDEKTKAELTKLAKKLDASTSRLAMFSIREMLKKPPTTIPKGCERKAFGTGAGGTASGFFVTPKLKAGKCTTVEINEVAVRSEGAGKSFFRYKKGDEKARTKALRDAKAEASYLLKLVGAKGKPKVTLLK